MILFLTTAPLWLEALIVVGLPTAAAMLGPSIVRRFVTLENLTTNNEVAGFKFATVGVLYAVLLAFSIIIVWQKYSDTDSTVAKEAGAAATIYHLSHGFGEVQGAAVRAALTNYLKSAISDEWPAMDRGGASKPTWQALKAIYAALLVSESPERSDTALTVGNFLSTRRSHASAPRQTPRSRGRRSRSRLGNSFRRRCRNNCLHVLLWNAEPAGANANDGVVVNSHVLGVADHRFSRSAVFGRDQGAS
jgi:hypothetical protein